MKKIKYSLALVLFIHFTTIVFAQKINISSGKWRGSLIRKDEISIPFVFDIETKQSGVIMSIINAEDTLRVNNFRLIGDSVLITLPFFDAEFMVKVSATKMQGRWTRHLPMGNTSIPFEASINQTRFDESHKITPNLNNTWDVKFFDTAFKDSSDAIGKFQSSPTKITGTFLTSTGDYRFLEGVFDGEKIRLSTFDGSHAYLVIADFNPQNNRISNGVFYSGLNNKEFWNASFNPKAALPDAEKLTFLKQGFESIKFEFPDLDNKPITLEDARFRGKVVLLQIMGSWCPNCLDESKLMTSIYQQYQSSGLEIIGLCFEKSEDINIVKKNIGNFKNQLNITYPLVIAGNTQKGSVNKALPMLANFVAFPTLIIIDKKGKVRNIHTGYSGPATGIYFTEFKDHFISNLEKYLNEK
ncbi:MAG: TlpA disulfide reductase family protein [Sphingobacteriaceae bacterium]